MTTKNSEQSEAHIPLAAAMRPRSLEDYQGQQHLLSSGKPLFEAIQSGQLHSMILWGPAGTGKTSLAMLMAEHSQAQFKQLSAVLSGVKEIKAVIDEAIFYRQQSSKDTILFVDEVHRFNKAQQDVFLPFVEEGSITFIGATTENPSFELNRALLSRCQVYVLESLSEHDVTQLIERALHKKQCKGLLSDEQCAHLARVSAGDARQALNFVEQIINVCHRKNLSQASDELIAEVLANTTASFDKQSDVFYELISALHKSVRGSDPDASLYWFCRMLVGGCDPLYIARRVVRMASEDIGNADPRALQLAMNAWDVQMRLGSPEGELALAQAITYLACAAKSNAVYSAYKSAMKDAKQYGKLTVPLHLRNAPTQLMKDQGYGKSYRYAHNEPHAYAAGENYFPDEMPNETRYYEPTSHGLEAKIQSKLAFLKSLDDQYKS